MYTCICQSNLILLYLSLKYELLHFNLLQVKLKNSSLLSTSTLPQMIEILKNQMSSQLTNVNH